MPNEKPKVDLQVFPYPRPLPKGWSHIMHVLDLNEEETSTPSYGPFSRWDGTYNLEHDSEERRIIRPLAKAMAVAQHFL